MADFGEDANYQFEVIGEDVGQGGEDPTAAFLAREQAQMAALQTDSGNWESSFHAPEHQSAEADFFSDAAPADNTGFEAPEQTATPVTKDPYAAVAAADQALGEPEPIRLWREKRTVELAEKEEKAKVEVENLKKAAKLSLDEFYQRYNEQLEKNKINNKKAEKAFIEERDEHVPGHEWERIVRLVDFNPKNSKNTKDTSRIRGILLQLKQTPLR
eukprot:Colp12_sorted_trinity150504_noHs@17193